MQYLLQCATIKQFVQVLITDIHENEQYHIPASTIVRIASRRDVLSFGHAETTLASSAQASVSFCGAMIPPSLAKKEPDSRGIGLASC